MQENSAEELPQLDAVQDNATQEDFHTKNKIYELLLYAGPQLEQFPKSQRRLADDIRGTMLNMLRLVVTLENKHYKKTTLGDLDNEVDVLRHLVRLAADPKALFKFNAPRPPLEVLLKLDPRNGTAIPY